MAAAPRTYETYRAGFQWEIPERFNIAAATIGRHADRRPRATALLVEDEDGTVRRYTFAEVRRLANRLANVLTGLGLSPGDRVAILLPQSAETALAHLAVYQSGLVAVPLFGVAEQGLTRDVGSELSGVFALVV